MFDSKQLHQPELRLLLHSTSVHAVTVCLQSLQPVTCTHLAVSPPLHTPTAVPASSNTTLASGLSNMYVPPYTALRRANACEQPHNQVRTDEQPDRLAAFMAASCSVTWCSDDKHPGPSLFCLVYRRV